MDFAARGPGYGLHAILQPTPRAHLKAQIITGLAPDILVLSGLDYDHSLAKLTAFRDLIAAEGHDFPHLFARPSNAGLRRTLPPTRRPGPDDAQGYGAYPGARGLAVLARLPLLPAQSHDYSGFLWQDLPPAYRADPAFHPPEDQRLSSTGHWAVAVDTGNAQPLTLLAYQAGPPVFGTESTRNLARNHDETRFWSAYLDDALPEPAPSGPLVVIGGANLDPQDGDGLHSAMRALLAHPRLQDPRPASTGAREARNAGHKGPPELDTVQWPQASGPGNLRVSYILPDRALDVRGSGVFWPLPDTPEAALFGPPDDPITRHKPVWVDLDRSTLARD